MKSRMSHLFPQVFLTSSALFLNFFVVDIQQSIRPEFPGGSVESTDLCGAVERNDSGSHSRLCGGKILFRLDKVINPLKKPKRNGRKLYKRILYRLLFAD